MRNLLLFALVFPEFILIQSCSKQHAVCDCIDMSTEMMKGERETNYDGRFRKNYLKEHQSENDACDKLSKSVKNKVDQEKIMVELKRCRGYDEYNKELQKQSNYLENR